MIGSAVLAHEIMDPYAKKLNGAIPGFHLLETGVDEGESMENDRYYIRFAIDEDGAKELMNRMDQP